MLMILHSGYKDESNNSLQSKISQAIITVTLDYCL